MMFCIYYVKLIMLLDFHRRQQHSKNSCFPYLHQKRLNVLGGRNQETREKPSPAKLLPQILPEAILRP